MKIIEGILEYDIKCSRCGRDEFFELEMNLDFRCRNCGNCQTYRDIFLLATLTGNVYNPLNKEFTKGKPPSS